jgi:hypothetical protein
MYLFVLSNEWEKVSKKIKNEDSDHTQWQQKQSSVANEIY